MVLEGTHVLIYHNKDRLGPGVQLIVAPFYKQHEDDDDDVDVDANVDHVVVYNDFDETAMLVCKEINLGDKAVRKMLLMLMLL